MIKRTLYFGNPAYLSLANSQLNIRLPELEKNKDLKKTFKEEFIKTIPIEDIGIIVLDHKQITITHGLIAALLINNTVLLTCDDSHHPTGLLLPLNGNSIQSERFKYQIEASEPLKKQLWAQTIIQKIKNQAKLLRLNNKNGDFLEPIYKNIKSGDSENGEGIAAAYYWKNFFDYDFKRSREGNPPNNYFNYGYSILRATMARSIVAAGLIPTLGIHHKNRYNAYCLADDLMEPYRPFVDQLVYNIIKEKGFEENLSKEIKTHLLKIPAEDVWIDGEMSPLMIATQRTAVSLVKCFIGEQKKLLYPELK